MDWIIENKEWIFSGIGVLLISGLIGIINYFKRKKSVKRERVVNQSGEKSIYVEKNNGEINIK